MTVDVDAAHHDFLLFGYYARYVVYDADVVVADDFQRYGVLRAALAAPLCLHHTVAEAFAQLRGVGAVGAVDLYAAADGYEAEHVVAVDGVAAFGEGVVNAFQVAVYHEYVIACGSDALVRVLVTEALGAACVLLLCGVVVVLLQLLVFIYHVVYVKAAVGDVPVEVVGLFETELLDEV